MAIEQNGREGSTAPLFINEVEGEKDFTYSEFWRMAGGFWTGKRKSVAIWLTLAIVLLVFSNIAIQYGINRWNKYFFDALEAKNTAEAGRGVLLFLALAATAILAMVTQVYFRLSLMANWRRWLTSELVGEWLKNRRFYQLNIAAPQVDGVEFRMTDDVRVATEPIVDFAIGLSNAVLLALVFVGVLWSAGGAISILGITIPGYFVFAAALYGLVTSSLMIVLGRPLISSTERKNAAEAQNRLELVRIRENAESIALIGGEGDEEKAVNGTLSEVLRRWRRVIRYQATATFIIHGNTTLAPVLPLLLGAPKYLAGEMSLGQLMQIAAAFVQVQFAFNWVVENYIRLAEWKASARRVVELWRTMRGFQQAEAGEERIELKDSEDDWLRLSNLSVAHHGGRIVISEAWAAFKPGSRVLIKGESGTGKSTLIRAIAGLWPWGAGEVRVPKSARMMFVPQKPYIPLGGLRAALLYPGIEKAPDDETLKSCLARCGLRHLTARLDDEDKWDKILSGGEQQRLAFARLLVHRPEIVIMDEATSALDEASQDSMMELFRDELSASMLLNVGHRPSLETWHDRVIILERKPRGAKIVEDSEVSPTGFGSKLGRFLRRSLRPRPSPDQASDLSSGP
ncbi:MAG: ABC transporter ATP-binding protein/permease [Proteobacteria bacterium]|nr:ABC transporter ATP-binding protein/permease [Pseudomonadota bacterium]